MALKFITRKNFHLTLFEKNIVPRVYDNIILSNIENSIIHTSKSDKIEGDFYIQLWEYFPTYLGAETDQRLRYNKVFQKLGFAINLDGYNDAQDFLEDHLKGSSKKTILRSIKRLESSLNITYKTFYGHITTEEYYSLMHVLHEMLIKRFQQRKDRNKTLENWDHYLNNFQNLINQKKGSLFVIYNGKEPIEIAINFHYNNILFSAISSYNLDYSKFSLGNIEIYKQLDWCIANNILLFDMGFGDFDYKRRWSNLIYNYESHIFSKPNNRFLLIYTFYLRNKYELINYVLTSDFILYYRKIRTFFKKNSQANEALPADYNIETVEKKTNFNIKENIMSMDKEENRFLRKPLMDFLYTNMENINFVSVYKIPSESNSFLIQGKSITIKISFTNNLL